MGKMRVQAFSWEDLNKVCHGHWGTEKKSPPPCWGWVRVGVITAPNFCPF